MISDDLSVTAKEHTLRTLSTFCTSASNALSFTAKENTLRTLTTFCTSASDALSVTAKENTLTDSISGQKYGRLSNPGVVMPR